MHSEHLRNFHLFHFSEYIWLVLTLPRGARTSTSIFHQLQLSASKTNSLALPPSKVIKKSFLTVIKKKRVYQQKNCIYHLREKNKRKVILITEKYNCEIQIFQFRVESKYLEKKASLNGIIIEAISELHYMPSSLLQIKYINLSFLN